MKLVGYIEVFDYVNNKTISRSKHSTLIVGDYKGTVCMLLQQPSNKNGVKYKVLQNIAKVYAKFLHEGKITIKFKDPSHELRLINDIIQLKSLLTLLHNICKPGGSSAGSSKGSTVPAIPEKPKFKKAPPTSAIIDSFSDIKVLDRLSLKVTKLQIANVDLEKIPSSISRLKDLAVLQVEKSTLLELPKAFSKFPVLTSLTLTNNCLGLGGYWNILDYVNLQEKLQFLDLSHNKITAIPAQIYALRELATLKVDYNSLYSVPHTLPRMKKLRHFSVSHNMIVSFPAPVFHLGEVHVDVSYNPHSFPDELGNKNPYKIEMGSELQISRAYFTKMRTLKELASRVIVNKRVPYRKVGLPSCLVHHLNEAKTCQQCGKSCFTHFFMVFGCARTKNFSREVVFTGSAVTTHFYVCSRECMLLSLPKLNRRSKASICYLEYPY